MLNLYCGILTFFYIFKQFISDFISILITFSLHLLVFYCSVLSNLVWAMKCGFRCTLYSARSAKTNQINQNPTQNQVLSDTISLKTWPNVRNAYSNVQRYIKLSYQWQTRQVLSPLSISGPKYRANPAWLHKHEATLSQVSEEVWSREF